MTKPSSEMIVIDKVYEFVIRTTNHVSRFPKIYRFTLGDIVARETKGQSRKAAK